MKEKRAQSRIICIILLVLLAVATGIFAVGTAESADPRATSAPKPRYGGTLKMADGGQGVSIGYPAKLARVFGMRQASPAIETLFRTDKTGKPVPWLVLSTKENPKAMIVTMTLRKGIKFHDGTDFDGETVKWNLDQCIAAKTFGTEKFKSVDVINQYTVQINLTEWDNTVTSNLASTLGMMISPTACKKNGIDWCANNPVGTGPFQFVSWEKDVKTVYKNFPGYWQKGKPYLDGIEIISIVDSTTRIFSLKKGEVDVTARLDAEDAASLEREGFLVHRHAAGSGSYGLIPDSANPKSPFADVRVRRAVQHAIDIKTILSTLYGGENELSNQIVSKGHWAYNPSVVGYPYNPAKARQLLKEAGYGSGFKTKISYRTMAQSDKLFLAVQAYLKAVGIDAELDPMLQGRQEQIVLQGGKWEGLIVSLFSPNPDVTALVAERYAGGERYFSQMLAPDDYKKAIGNAVTAGDFGTKQKWARETMKLLTDKYCLQIILYCMTDLVATRPYVRNHGFNETPNTAYFRPEDVWLDR